MTKRITTDDLASLPPRQRERVKAAMRNIAMDERKHAEDQSRRAFSQAMDDDLAAWAARRKAAATKPSSPARRAQSLSPHLNKIVNDSMRNLMNAKRPQTRIPVPQELRALNVMLGLDDNVQVAKEANRGANVASAVTSAAQTKPLNPGAAPRSAYDDEPAIPHKLLDDLNLYLDGRLSPAVRQKAFDLFCSDPDKALMYLSGRIDDNALEEIKRLLATGGLGEDDDLDQPTGNVSNPARTDQPPPFPGRPDRGGSGREIAQDGRNFDYAMDQWSRSRRAGGPTLEQVLEAKAASQYQQFGSHSFDDMFPHAHKITTAR
jgi:hypothetical protein